MKFARHHKYHAIPTVIDGIRFASKRESKRYSELKLMEKAGVISGLGLQPRFTLLEKREGQRAITYVADFSYMEYGDLIVEDVKGIQTEAFKIKKKLFKAKYPSLILRITK